MLSRFAAGRVKSGAVGRFDTSSTAAAGASEELVAMVFSMGGSVSCPHATVASAKTPISTVAAAEFLNFKMGFMGYSSILVQGAPFECSSG